METKRVLDAASVSPTAREVDRRDFLVLGAACAAAPLVARYASSAATGLEAEAAALAVAPLALGYLEGTDRLADLAGLRWSARTLARQLRDRWPEEAGPLQSLRLTPADKLDGGDPTLAGGFARIGVLGTLPADPMTWDGSLRRVELSVAADVRAADGSGPVRFVAWGLSRRTAPYVSPSLRFTVPVPSSGPELRLDVTVAGRDGRASVQTTSSRFTTAAATGCPRLRRGIYLLGLTTGPLVLPRWLLLDAKTGLEGPAGLVLVVDRVAAGRSAGEAGTQDGSEGAPTGPEAPSEREPTVE
jgi:hypothetical protein